MQIRKLKKFDFIALECKDLVSEGLGISYLIDESLKEKVKPHVAFIWGALPGERFVARVTQSKSKNFQGIIARRDELPESWFGMFDANFVHSELALYHASEQRVTWDCENFMQCGGCKLRHLTYEHTLKYKGKWFESQLRHHQQTHCKVVLCGADQKSRTHYRNHIQLHINKFGDRGFYAPYSYRTKKFPEHGCLIFDEKSLRDKFPVFPVETKVVRVRHDKINAPVFTEFNSLDDRTKLCDYTIEWGGYREKITVPVDGFFQANPSMISIWLDRIDALLAPYLSEKSARVLELFSGFGFISHMLALRHNFSRWGIDVIKRESLKKVAYHEAKSMQRGKDFIENYFMCDLFNPEKFSREFFEFIQKSSPDILIMNPPRAGLIEASWKKIRENALQHFSGPILYSSCNGSTFARDLATLTKDGYQTDEIFLLDFFPWTHHYEVVALLQVR